MTKCKYNGKITTYNDISTTYDSKTTAYNDKRTAYNDKSTAYNIINSTYNERSTTSNKKALHIMGTALHVIKQIDIRQPWRSIPDDTIVMFFANLFSRICSARGQFVIVVANQCKHVALLGKSTKFQGRFPFEQKFRKFRVGERMEQTFSGISFRNFGCTSRGWPKIPENRNDRKIPFQSTIPAQA